MADIVTIRKRLEIQGFHGLDNAALAEIGPWMRWSPALCTTVMVAGVLSLIYQTLFARRTASQA